VAGDLLGSLLNCDGEEPGDDEDPVVAEKAVEVAEGTSVVQFLVFDSTSIATI